MAKMSGNVMMKDKRESFPGKHLVFIGVGTEALLPFLSRSLRGKPSVCFPTPY